MAILLLLLLLLIPRREAGVPIFLVAYLQRWLGTLFILRPCVHMEAEDKTETKERLISYFVAQSGKGMGSRENE